MQFPEVQLFKSVFELWGEPGRFNSPRKSLRFPQVSFNRITVHVTWLIMACAGSRIDHLSWLLGCFHVLFCASIDSVSDVHLTHRAGWWQPSWCTYVDGWWAFSGLLIFRSTSLFLVWIICLYVIHVGSGIGVFKKLDDIGWIKPGNSLSRVTASFTFVLPVPAETTPPGGRRSWWRCPSSQSGRSPQPAGVAGTALKRWRRRRFNRC